MDKQKIHIEELLPLYIERKANREQIAQVEAWIAESHANQEIFDAEMALFRYTDALFTMGEIDADQGLKEVHQKMFRSRWIAVIRAIERVAAILFIPLLITILWQVNRMNSQEVNMLSIRTNPGMTTTTILPDGSVVTLNSNSELTYPAHFKGKERNLTLVGEAYFSVAKDVKHPFIVSTANGANIKVYGTKFNVEAYLEEKATKATLVEGSIAMTFKNEKLQDCERKIVPGEKIIYSYQNRDVNVEKVDVDVAISWVEDKLIFKNTPIREVFRTLSKRYGVNFNVKNQRVYQNAFTGTLEKQRLDRVLEILELSSGIKFKYKDNIDIHECNRVIEVY